MASVHRFYETIFSREQKGMPLQGNVLDSDLRTFYLILEENGEGIAAGRVSDTDGAYSISEIAVAAEYRNKGYGTAAVNLLLNKARQLGAAETVLISQTATVGFYEKLGFISYGDEFYETDIPYVRMKKVFNNEQYLQELVSNIIVPDKSLYDKAWQRLDSLMKPPGSLGGLEEIAAKLAAIKGLAPYRLDKKCILIMCADNGIVEEGVASAPQEVTVLMTYNFAKGLTGVSVLAKELGSDLNIIDVGIVSETDHPAIINKKIKYGTNNFTKEPAMTRDEAVRAMLAGFDSAREAKMKGYDVIGVGEMGIGNTTTASAVLSGITGASSSETVGKGAGLDDEGYNKKKLSIENALIKHNVNGKDMIDIIHKVGGLDIAAMTGAYLGAAYSNLPVVADGFISTVSAFAAVKICPAVKNYLFLSHASYEKGYKLAASEIGLEPVFNLNMRLGEGSGCPLFFKVMDGAAAVIRDMGTFAQGNIESDYIDKVKDASNFEV